MYVIFQARRNESKSKYNSASERLKRELALLLGKKTAVSTLLGKQISPKKGSNAEANIDDIFKLPALPEKEESESEYVPNKISSIQKNRFYKKSFFHKLSFQI